MRGAWFSGRALSGAYLIVLAGPLVVAKRGATGAGAFCCALRKVMGIGCRHRPVSGRVHVL